MTEIKPRIYPLCQLAMSPTKVTTSLNKMKKFWMLVRGRLQITLVEARLCLFTQGWLGLLASLKPHLMSSTTQTRLDDVEVFWGTKDWLGCHCSFFKPGHIGLTNRGPTNLIGVGPSQGWGRLSRPDGTCTQSPPTGWSK